MSWRRKFDPLDLQFWLFPRGRDNSKNSPGCPVTATVCGRLSGENRSGFCRYPQGLEVTSVLTEKETTPAAAVAATCGPMVIASARQVLNSAAALARLERQLIDLLAVGTPVALRVENVGRGQVAIDRLRHLCERLGRALRGAGLDPVLLELTLGTLTVPPHAAVNVRTTTLGAGVVNLIVDEASITAAVLKRARQCSRTWLQLWQLRSHQVFTAFWPTVNSPCSLLSSEKATDVIPDIGLQAPLHAAFVSCELELYRLSDSCGRTNMRALEIFLAGMLEAAETRHDMTTWPTPAMQQDSWYNRRVAVRIVGIGDYALRHGLDPDRHASVKELITLISMIRRLAIDQSRRIARRREILPAIAATNPCRRLPADGLRDNWERRWQNAIAQSALRHRNLLVMSPWSVFPTGVDDYRYANLLPILAYADACEFRRSLSLETWNTSRFIDFHRRVWALRQQSNAAMVIAEQL